MVRKILHLLGKCKSYAITGYSIYDLTELLHHPWHDHELMLLLTIICWIVVAKITVIAFLQFNKVLPFIFNKSNCKFFLWLLYYSLSIITVSNLVCNFMHGISIEMLVIKIIITVVALLIDWRETKEAISKYKEISN